MKRRSGERSPVECSPGTKSSPAPSWPRAGHVRGMAAVEGAARGLLPVQGDEGAVGQHALDEAGVLRVRAVAPDDAVRPRLARDLVHPTFRWRHEIFILGAGFRGCQTPA